MLTTPTTHGRTIDFLAGSSSRAAPGFIDDLLKTIEKIVACPDIGTAQPLFGPHVRTWPLRRWVIVYERHERFVEVVRVLSAKQDIRFALRGR